MSAAHWPGRLHVESRTIYALNEIGVNHFFATVQGFGAKEDEQIANARRLAACWNAFAGISTEQLEENTAAGVGVLALSNAADFLLTSRDELLSACEFVLANAFERKWQGDGRAFTMLTAAIAKATEVQP